MTKTIFSIRIGPSGSGQAGQTFALELSQQQKLALCRITGRPPDQIEFNLEELTNRTHWREMHKTE